MSETGPADLLAHTEWLTRLARALVGDAAADDVVQDTYEVALTRPPKREGAIRPWLGGVARNLAKMRTRARVRREGREHRAAVDDPLPTPEDLVARAELQQKVGRLVLELPEPLRATVLLRFFEGMTAADIAARQGIPAATARSRLKDALDRIRAALDAEHDRRTWMTLLAPLGGLVMKTSIKITIAVVIAIVVVAGTRLAGVWGGSAPTPPASLAAAPPPPKSQPHAPAPSTAPAREVPAIHDDDPKGNLRLEGQVIDERDQPVAHARVAIDTNPPIVVETEADGAFVFDGLIRRDYWLEATAGDRYAGPARLRLGDKPEPITLRAHEAGTVEVAVTARLGGAPVKGAEVELRSALTWKATTDDKGIARVTGVGGIWMPVAVRAPGFAPAAMMVTTTGDPATTDHVAIALAGGAALSGHVVDEQGKPVADARVVALSAADAIPVIDPHRDGVTTGADGAFALDALSAGTWRLTAIAGDHAPASSVPITVDGEHPRTGVDIVLVTGASVQGAVRDPAGKPVAGAEVSLVVHGFVPWRARRQAFTDDAGAFRIAGLERRAYDAVAWHDSGASAIAPIDLAARADGELAFVLDVTGTIAGTVVDTRGKPLADAQVIAAPEYGGGPADRAAWGVRGVQETVTDQGGGFRFAGLPDADYRVHAARAGASEGALWLGEGTAARPSPAPIQIVVPAEGRVIGKVQLPDGKAPATFAVALGDTRARPFAAADGAFALPAAAGAYPVTLTGPGFVTVSKPATVAEGKDTDLGTISVTPGRSISGRVTDANGAPVANAKVAAGALLTGGGTELYIATESLAAKDTQTDDDGRFVLDGFPPAPLTVIAGKPGTGRSASVRLPASPDSATLDLVLAGTTRLDGKITRSGAPFPDAIVIAQPIGATTQNFFVSTGPDGAFVLDALAPGPYIVSVMVGGGGPRPGDIYARRAEATAGGTGHVEIDATPGPITLAVTVKTEKGAPLPGAGLMEIPAAIEARTMDDLRDGSKLPPDQTLAMHRRGVVAGAATVEGLQAGVHTVCLMLGDPRVPSPDNKMQCTPAKLSAAPKQAVTIVVPASWVAPGK